MKDKRRTPAKKPKTEPVKTVPPDGFSEALEGALESLPEPPPSDTAIVDWMEAHAFTTGSTADGRVQITYRENPSGRDVIAFAPTIREAVIGAIRDEQG